MFILQEYQVAYCFTYAQCYWRNQRTYL